MNNQHAIDLINERIRTLRDTVKSKVAEREAATARVEEVSSQIRDCGIELSGLESALKHLGGPPVGISVIAPREQQKPQLARSGK